MIKPATDAWLDYDRAAAGQAEAALPRNSAWVAANAGSGKTKVLIDRVARLLLAGAEPDEILCVTYTKAAASEMQARLFARLGSWCVMDDATLNDELRKLEGREQTAKQLNRARELFAKALETPGGLRIETIHAFCGRVLRRFPLEARVPPGFSELDDVDTGEMWDKVIRRLGALAALAEDPKLAAAARLVAECDSAALGVLRDLDIRRTSVTAFIERHGDVDNAIAALADRLGATGESEVDIVERAVGRDLPAGNIRLALEAWRTGTANDQKQAVLAAAVLSDLPAEDRFRALKALVFTAKGELRKTIATKKVADTYPVILDLFSTGVPEGSETLRIQAVEEQRRAARIFERSAALICLADAAFEDFRWRKTARAGLDFDDLIQSVSRLLSLQDAAEWVLWKLDGGIGHILLDEAQDTSPGQWSILKSLTNDMLAGKGTERHPGRTLFVVGDQKQSIYSFQGADPAKFLSEGRRYIDAADAVDPDWLRRPHLAMSFRSAPEVLAYVDEVFDPGRYTDTAPFSMEPPHEADHSPHTAFRRNETGSVELWPLEPPGPPGDEDPWHAPLDHESFASPRVQLAGRVAKFIRQQIEAGAAVWDGKTQRPCRPGDFLILVKGRISGIFDAVLEALKRENLPVAGADRLRLLDSLAVQDLLNLIRFVLCPEDDLVLAEILKGPFGGLTDQALEDLAWDRRSASLWSRLQTADAHGEIRHFLEALLDRRHDAPFEFLAWAMEETDGLPQRGWDLVLTRFGQPAREPVTALIDRAAAYDSGGPPSLELFLAAIEHQGGEVKRELSGKADEVRVMTVHGAKGLEAPIVILPETTAPPRLDTSGVLVAGDGAPIWAGAKDEDTALTRTLRDERDARALREHRRLLYVALTRAQDRLIVCGSWYGKGPTGFHADSWYALCDRAMLALVETGKAAPEDADAATAVLRLGAAPPSLGKAKDAPAAAQALPAWLTQPAAPEPSRRRVVAPSALGGAEPPGMAPFGEGRAERLRRGRLIHALFEALPSLPEPDRLPAAESFLARQPDLRREERTEILKAAMDVVDDPRFAAVFSPLGRAEAPVIGRIGETIVNGRVDRLVVAPTEVLIVDYKTDRPAPSRPEDVGEAYRLQMAAYRAILTQAWPDRPVRCLLVWTDGPKLMELDPADLEKALNRVLN
jgi:ATP-dependent helicase/nuclease subunit A